MIAVLSHLGIVALALMSVPTIVMDAASAIVDWPVQPSQSQT